MPEIFNASEHQPETSNETVEQTVNVGDVVSLEEKPVRTVNDYSEVMRDESEGNNPLAAFIAKPTDIRFDAQASTEKIILVLRKHPITQIPWVLSAILAAFLPVLFSSISLLDFLPPNYQLAAAMGWYMLLIGFILEKILQWFYNVYIITDERIIDVDFISLIYKNISSAKLDNIEDVTATTGGAIQSVFNFGTIKIQTAAEKNEFEFEEVPKPAKVARLLNELLLEEEREKLEGRVS